MARVHAWQIPEAVAKASVGLRQGLKPRPPRRQVLQKPTVLRPSPCPEFAGKVPALQKDFCRAIPLEFTESTFVKTFSFPEREFFHRGVDFHSAIEDFLSEMVTAEWAELAKGREVR